MAADPGMVDANVLAYALNAHAPQHAASRVLPAAASDPSARLYVTSQIPLPVLFGDHQPATLFRNAPRSFTAIPKRRYARQTGQEGNGALTGTAQIAAHAGSNHQRSDPPACGGRNRVRSAHAPLGIAGSDPADHDWGRQSLPRTLGWTQRRGVGFAQDLLEELAWTETPKNGPL